MQRFVGRVELGNWCDASSKKARKSCFSMIGREIQEQGCAYWGFWQSTILWGYHWGQLLFSRVKMRLTELNSDTVVLRSVGSGSGGSGYREVAAYAWERNGYAHCGEGCGRMSGNGEVGQVM